MRVTLSIGVRRKVMHSGPAAWAKGVSMATSRPSTKGALAASIPCRGVWGLSPTTVPSSTLYAYVCHLRGVLPVYWACKNIAQHQSSCPPPPPRPSHFHFTTIIITPSSPPLPHPPTTPLSLTINFISQNQNEERQKKKKKKRKEREGFLF
ncbi:hypothetical protein NC651_033833 [Populus alba x Populus x berolinensis]|nr:hypothetical protein NC651_033833 [Populus alba x Populus x berolinensis]